MRHEIQKEIAGGTTTLFRNKFKYTTETKKFKYFIERNCFKI
jgi:hypothetical protein